MEEISKPKSEDSQASKMGIYYGKTEQTFQDSSYVPATYDKPYNSDDLFKKNYDYTLYEEMLKDDQCRAVSELQKDMILGSGFDIKASEENQEEIVEFLNVALNEDPYRSFSSMLREIISSYDFGFSISEIIYKEKEKAQLTLENIKTRHPASWLIHQDERGNITNFEQRGVKTSSFISPDQLLHMINNQRFDNPYGESDLRPAYDAYIFKRHVLRMYAIFIEKAASPTPVGMYDKTVKDADVATVFNTLKKLQTKTAMCIPDAFKVEFLETSNKGEAFERAIDMLNMFIGRAVLVPDLLGVQGARVSGGSFAATKEQLEIYLKRINSRRDELERLVNLEIIWPLVIWNYGDIKNYPKFKLKPVFEKDLSKFADLWLRAINGNQYKPNIEEVNHFREIIGYPQGEVEIPAPPANPRPFKKEFKLASDAVKRVDFKMLKNKLNANEDQFLAETKPIANEAIQNIMDQVRKKKILQTGNVDKIESLGAKGLAKMRVAMKNNLFQAYKDAKALSNAELSKITKASKVQNTTDLKSYAAPLLDEEFLKILDAELYNYIGDWEYAITKKVRTNLIAAIKDGTPLSQIEGILTKDLEALSDTSLERYARTKHTEVLNKGRVAAFNESPVVQGYEYSAILDDVTTEVCRGLDGKQFAKGTEPVPPMHFNCRSVLVPIIIGEEFEQTKKIGSKNVNDWIDENKGEGFSTK